MQSAYVLSPRAVATRPDCTCKASAFDALAELFGTAYDMAADVVREALDEREALGSTGFGGGIAFPHARIAGLQQPVAALVRLERPIDFAAADALPVDLLFGLLSPEGSGAAHLHALASMSRLMRVATVPATLRRIDDADGLYAALTDAADDRPDHRNAA